MKKKFIILALSIVAALFCAICAVACSWTVVEDSPTVHTHSWSNVYTIEGDKHYQTCKKCGEKKYSFHSYNSKGVCVCGKKNSGQGETNPSKPLECAHKSLLRVCDSQPSTCVEQGYNLDIRICLNYIDNEKTLCCGAVFSGGEDAPQKIGQYDNLNDVVFKEMCDNKRASFGQYYTELPLSAHTPVIDEGVAATCVSKGKTEGSHCGYCNTVIKAQEDIDFAEHDYSDKITLILMGRQTLDVCTACGQLKNDPRTFKAELNGDGNSYTLVKASGEWSSIDFGYVLYNDKSVTDIGKSAFRDCASLKSVALSGITHIGEYAFGNCTNLNNIVLYDSLTAIDAVAFSGCGMSEIIIPDSVKTIGQNAFYKCLNLTSATIGKGVETICSPLFMLSTNLESVVWNATACVDMTGTSDWNSTFYTCENLKHLVVGDNVTRIPDRTFFDCRFESVTTPANASYVLYNCYSIKELTVTCGNIGEREFSQWSELTTVRVKDGVTGIGDWALYGCSMLTDIYFDGTKEQWKAITKGSGWKSDTGDFTVTCTDGKLTKEEAD